MSTVAKRTAVRRIGATAFTLSAMVFAAWTGGYLGAALDPVDATPAQLLGAAALTAAVGAGLASCAWALIRPERRTTLAGATILAAVTLIVFIYRWRYATA